MKEFEDLKVAEVEALSNFSDRLEETLKDMDAYRLFLNKRKRRKYDKLYQDLVNVWEDLQNKLIYLWDADERSKYDE